MINRRKSGEKEASKRKIVKKFEKSLFFGKKRLLIFEFML